MAPATSSKIITDYADMMHQYDPSKYVSRNVLSRYEKTKILGLRMEQLARGAQRLWSDPDGVSSESMHKMTIRDIALKELEHRKLPFMVMRVLSNGDKEVWRLADMIVLPD